MDIKTKFNAGDDAVFLDENLAHKYRVERVEAVQTMDGCEKVSNVFRNSKGEEFKKADELCFENFEKLKDFLKENCDVQYPLNDAENGTTKDDGWDRMAQNANEK